MGFPHRISEQFEAVSIVDEAVQDRIRKRGIRNAFMPAGDRDLGGHEGGGAAVAVIDDFKQVFGLRAGEGVTQPVIKNEQVEAGERAQQLGIRAIRLGESEGLQQAGIDPNDGQMVLVNLDPSTTYTVQAVAINGDGEMPYVVELSTDVSDIERLRQEGEVEILIPLKRPGQES